MAVVRVKRRLNDEPVEALLVACKRLRTVTSSEDEKPTLDDVQSIFTFAGTMGNKDGIASPHLATVVKQEQAKQKNPKLRTIDISGQSRKAHQTSIKNNRFKLVNSHRASLPVSDLDKEEEDKKDLDLPVYDVIDENDGDEDVKDSLLLKEYQSSEISCNGIPMLRQDAPENSIEHQYVYDLYYAPTFNDVGVILEHSFCIERFMDPKFVQYRSESPTEFASDEDSNDENHYANEYPEEDSDFETDPGFWRDYDEDNVAEWLSTCSISKPITSDDEDSEPEPEPAEADIYLHGESYARFKAKVMKEFKERNVQFECDEDELADDNLTPM